MTRRPGYLPSNNGFIRSLFLTAAPAAGSGPGAPAPAAPAPALATPAAPPAPPAQVTGQEVDEFAAQMRARYGEGWARVIARENIELSRERNAERERRTNLEQRVAAGALLEGETLERWKKLTKLGKTPEEITALLAEYPKLETKVRTAELNEVLDASAPGIGWVNAAAVRAAVAREGLHIEKREEEIEQRDARGKVTGKVKVTVPYARPLADDKAALVRLDQVESLKPFHAAFTQGPAAPVAVPGVAAAPAPTGVQWPTTPSPAAPAPGAVDPVGAFIENRNAKAAARPDPFARRTAASGLSMGFGVPASPAAPAGGSASGQGA